jgi:sulfite oxidase
MLYLAGFVAGATTAFSWSRSQAAGGPTFSAGEYRADLPTFPEAEVLQHGPTASRVWVTYRAGVYDVTDFVDKHPGGRNRIMLAAGASIEPFWRQFSIHNHDEVRKILEGQRIGNLKEFDPVAAAAKQEQAEREAQRMWDEEPKRHPALTVKSAKPFNAETPAAAMTGASVVANEIFYVRNHMPVPDIDASNFCLEVRGEGLKSRCHTLEDLKRKFTQHTVESSIQCGGNRRSDAAKAGPVKGLSWTGGAIGNASWRGVWLRDVIEEAADGEASHLSGHVKFGGADRDAASKFEVSIPVPHAMDPDRDVLIAYEMNGEQLPRDHGYPLRAVVPGVVGVRNCKWLTSVTVDREESQSDWQQRDYKNFPSWLKGPEPGYDSVYDMPIQSQITEATRDGDEVTVKGYAYCGGGRGVQRVEVSSDGGRVFERAARLDDCGIQQPKGKRWAWYQFESSFTLPGELGKKAADTVEPVADICARAISGTHDVQPPIAALNFRGLLYNGYSCVRV